MRALKDFLEVTVLLSAALSSTSQPVSQVAACVAALQRQHFEECRQVTVLGASELSVELRGLVGVPRRAMSLAGALAWRAAETFPEGLPVYNYLTDLYVVDLRNESAGAALLAVLPMDSRTPVIVVVAAAHSPQSAANAAVGALWGRELVNALVLVAGADRVSAYSFEPFSRCHAAPAALLLDQWAAGCWLGSGRALFPRNERLRLGSCPLVVNAENQPVAVLLREQNPRRGWRGDRAMEVQPLGVCQCASVRASPPPPARHLRRAPARWATGVIIEMLHEIGQHVDMRVPYCLQSACDGVTYGTFYRNGTATGMYADLQAGRADAAVAYFLTKPSRSRGAELFTTGHMSESVWIVPSGLGGELSPLRELTRPFQPGLWAALAATAAASSVTVWLLASRSRGRGGSLSRFEFALGFTLCSLLGVPCAGRVPRLSALRLFLFLWFMFTLVVSTSFLAIAKGRLFRSMRNADINTLGEALELGLGVELHQVTWEDLKVGCENTTDSDITNILRLATIQESAMTTISETVARGRRTLSLQIISTVNYYLKREGTTASGIHILPVRKCVPTIPTSWIVLRKGSVLAPTVKVLVNRMMAAGLIEHWISRFTPEGTKSAKDKKALAVKNLEPSWKLLALGHALAVLAFLGEHAVFRARPRPRAGAFTKLAGSWLFKYNSQ